ncbi:hypothetical protein OIU77_018969 [Salix suchowensis]|uniref:Uncharacterized protein n=1 Tax=Salix suchowensis TaxID=1278906 RepID=A0ABQ9CI50_9ROSI|nr:hypothetical protein OIU77_018969 [Salix suchowensis]
MHKSFLIAGARRTGCLCKRLSILMSSDTVAVNDKKGFKLHKITRHFSVFTLSLSQNSSSSSIRVSKVLS